MKRHLKYLPLAFLALPLVSCDNNLVPRVDYDALLAERDALEAENDSLQIENAELHLYNYYLEAKLDSCETLEE